MKERDYQRLQRRLNTLSDIDALCGQGGYDRELLIVAYTQNVVRDATKRYYRMKRDVNRFLGEWRRGKSLMEIADVNHFPPILMAQLILLHSGVGRKTFWRWVRGEEKVPDERLSKEIKEIAGIDIIYSPKGMRMQKIRGLRGERRLELWLESRGIKFKTEEDLRGQSTKTPDSLLDKPITLRGKPVYWIESKANFGDRAEVRRNMTRQLIPYTKLFGPGVVVYWLGYVEDHGFETGDVMVMDGAELTGTPGLDPVTEAMVADSMHPKPDDAPDE